MNEDEKAPAASLKRRKWGSGVPEHVHIAFIQLILISIQYVYHINYIVLSIAPSWAEEPFTPFTVPGQMSPRVSIKLGMKSAACAQNREGNIIAL